ncbi:hypothetical protein ACFLYS_01840 [Chloroflexota bacterium]
MWVVIWLVVALASLTAILSVPFDILFRIEVYKRPKFSIRLKWLFGLLKKDVGGKRKPEEKRGERKRGEGRRWLRTIFEIVRIEGILERLRYLVKDILNHLKIRELQVSFKVVLDNAQDTSILLGIIESLRLFWRPSFPHEIDIRADYEGEVVLEGYAHLAVRVLPVQIVASLLRFLFSWSVIKAVKILVGAKWRKP